MVVDQGSLQLLAGSTVDFEDEMMKSAFVVTDNPQSAQGCGCGTSFSVEICAELRWTHKARRV